MKIVRVPFAVSLALLAATPAHAAIAPPPPPKPPAEAAPDLDRAAWRAQGIAICTADLGAPEGVTADEVEGMCGCAVDRFSAGVRPDVLPPIAAGQSRTTLGGQLLACASGQRPAVAAAVARRLAEPRQGAMPADAAKPVESSDAPPAEAPKRPGSDLRSWWDGLSLPAWITDSGLPPWAWALLGMLGFLLLRGLFRGGDQRDLIGPPPSSRLGARANPPPPRRADPPQRP